VDWSQLTPETLPGAIWSRLVVACGTTNDPWRTPALATGSGTDRGLRTVVLRAVDADRRELTLFSDSRAGKVRQLTSRNLADWLFYDPTEKVQLRLHGISRCHWKDTESRRLWENVPPVNRVNYCATVPPGTELPERGTGLPGDLAGQKLTLENTARGWEHFAVLITTVTDMDWLWLRTEGHWRARFTWTNDEWKGTWVAP